MTVWIPLSALRQTFPPLTRGAMGFSERIVFYRSLPCKREGDREAVEGRFLISLPCKREGDREAVEGRFLISLPCKREGDREAVEG